LLLKKPLKKEEKIAFIMPIAEPRPRKYYRKRRKEGKERNGFLAKRGEGEDTPRS